MQLLDYIYRRTHTALPTPCYARAQVFLFSEATLTAKASFSTFLEEGHLLSNTKFSLVINNVSSFQPCLEEIERRKTTGYLRVDIPIIINLVLAGNEERPELIPPSGCLLQTIRLAENDSAYSNDALYCDNSEEGLLALAYCVYLQSAFSSVPAPLSSYMIQGVWAYRQGLIDECKQNRHDLKMLLYPASDENTVWGDCSWTLDRCEIDFVTDVKNNLGLPSLSSYPIRGEGLKRQTYNRAEKLRQGKFLQQLFGIEADGSASSDLFIDEFIQIHLRQLESLFHNVWNSEMLEPFPLLLVIERLEHFCREHAENARREYKRKQQDIAIDNQRRIVRFHGGSPTVALKELGLYQESLFDLYEKRLAVWFWESALHDAAEGPLRVYLTSKKEEVHSSYTKLNSFLGKDADSPVPFKSWSRKAVQQAIRCHCTLKPAENGKLFALAREQEDSLTSELQSTGFPHWHGPFWAEWLFLPDFSVDAIAVLSLVPLKEDMG